MIETVYTPRAVEAVSVPGDLVAVVAHLKNGHRALVVVDRPAAMMLGDELRKLGSPVVVTAELPGRP